jgi:predicted metalloprotease
MPIAFGGGGLGIVALIIYLVVQFASGGSGSGSGSGGGTVLDSLGSRSTGNAATNSDVAQECHTGADANRNLDCAVVADIDSIQAYWTDELPSLGTRYVDAYVLAHEYGHHVQDLLGTESKVQAGVTGPKSGSVRLELQADCYAGVWAHHATTTPGPNGQVLISSITQDDVNRALDTAGRIGDDYIQTHLGGGQVDRSSFTHGTSAQREKWFSTGYRTGDPGQCDTFDTNNLG